MDSVFVKRLDKAVYMIEFWILLVGFGLMPLICLWQVLCRYIFKISAVVAEEAMRTIFCWCTFIGSSMAISKKSHMAVEAIINMFPPALKKALMFLIFLLCCVCCFFFTYESFLLVKGQIERGQLLPISRLPSAFATACMPLGFLLMSIRYMFATLESISPRKQAGLDGVN